MRKQSGFTLLEMMVVIGMIAIFAAILVPNFISYITYNKYRAAYMHFESTLQRSRIMAVKKAADVQVTVDQDENSYIIREQNCDIAAEELQCYERSVFLGKRYSGAMELKITSGHSSPMTFTFTPRGILSSVDSYRFTIGAKSEIAVWSFVITPTGNIITRTIRGPGK
ncbi:MAG: prepilin-type N-terminal cleavage/methylation domain-containing protein [Desulfobacterales bacterium]|nr:prepilin-type N-terminal cleavage/methylation domain-containing protein [Desulfobacterales bacterium]